MDKNIFTSQDIERFESKIVKTASCWLWSSARPLEYGAFYTTMGCRHQAHRASYAIFKGECSDNLQVCHKCDIPACVNPEHLFLGTAKDNALDKMQKGRLPKERAPYAPYRSYTRILDGKLYAVANIRQPNGTYRKRLRRIQSADEASAVVQQLFAEFDSNYRGKEEAKK